MMPPGIFVNALILATFADFPQVALRPAQTPILPQHHAGIRRHSQEVCKSATTRWPKTTTHGGIRPSPDHASSFNSSELRMAKNMQRTKPVRRGTYDKFSKSQSDALDALL
jgi:hypothetical protein